MMLRIQPSPLPIPGLMLPTPAPDMASPWWRLQSVSDTRAGHMYTAESEHNDG